MEPEPPFVFTLDKVIEQFESRDALIDFILDVKDKDTDKMKKPMNVFVCFRKVYNAVLPPSSSRRQYEVSRGAGRVWELEKQHNWDFWKNLLVGVYVEHAHRFPSSCEVMNKALHNLLGAPPETEAVSENTLPQPRKRENRGGAERTRTSTSRPAPYTLSRPGSSSSSLSLSLHPSSSTSSFPVTTSQGSPSAAPFFSTPPSFPTPLSAQPAPLAHLDGDAGWQASRVQVPPPMPPYAALTSLDGGPSQYMPPFQPARMPAAPVLLDVQDQDQYAEQAEVPTSYACDSGTIEGLYVPYREDALAYGEGELPVGNDLLSQILAAEAEFTIPFPVWTSGSGSVNEAAPTSQQFYNSS